AVFLQGSEIERQIGHAGRQYPTGGAARQVALEGVAIRHAAAELFYQFAHRDAGRRELDAGVLDAARHREAAKSLALVAALRRHPLGAFLDDVADPEQRLDVLLERWAAEQADLGNVRRTMARQAALTFDRFDHRRLFAADVGAGAATHVNAGVRREARLLDLGDLVEQHQPH